MVPDRTFTFTLNPSDMVLVRGLMIAGLSLHQIADMFQLSVKQIDQSLWAWLGEKL